MKVKCITLTLSLTLFLSLSLSLSLSRGTYPFAKTTQNGSVARTNILLPRLHKTVQWHVQISFSQDYTKRFSGPYKCRTMHTLILTPNSTRFKTTLNRQLFQRQAAPIRNYFFAWFWYLPLAIFSDLHLLPGDTETEPYLFPSFGFLLGTETICL